MGYCAPYNFYIASWKFSPTWGLFLGLFRPLLSWSKFIFRVSVLSLASSPGHPVGEVGEASEAPPKHPASPLPKGKEKKEKRREREGEGEVCIYVFGATI